MAKRNKPLTEREIVAYTILGEAVGEGDTGMAAVAQVIKNRSDAGQGSLAYVAQKSAKSKGKTVYQFSTWGETKKPTAKFSRYGTAMQNALKIVDAVTSGQLPDITGGSLNYYANKGVNAIKEPGWFAASAPAGTIQIGNQIYAARNDSRVDLTEYGNALAAAKEGAPTPLNKPWSVLAAQNNARAVRGGNVQLPASKAALDALSAAYGGKQPLGGGLVTRKVQTVPVGGEKQAASIAPAVGNSDIDAMIDYLSLTKGDRAKTAGVPIPREANAQGGRADKAGTTDGGANVQPPKVAAPKTAPLGIRSGTSMTDPRGTVKPSKTPMQVEIGKVYTDKNGNQVVAVQDLRSGFAVLVKPKDLQKELTAQQQDSIYDFATKTLGLKSDAAYALSRSPDPGDPIGQLAREGIMKEVGKAATAQLNRQFTGATEALNKTMQDLYGGAIDFAGGAIRGFSGELGKLVQTAGSAPTIVRANTQQPGGARPEGPAAGLPAGIQPTVAGRPDAPVGQLPGANVNDARKNVTEQPWNPNIPPTTTGREGGSQDKRTVPYSAPVAGKPNTPVGSLPAGKSAVSANANLINEKLNAQPRYKLVTQTVTVKNPAYRPAGSDKQEARDPRRANVQPGQAVTAPVEPEYITKQITVKVPVKQAAAIIPTAPKVSTQTPYVVGNTYKTGVYNYELQADGTFKQLGPVTGKTGAQAYAAAVDAQNKSNAYSAGGNAADRADYQESKFYSDFYSNTSKSLV